MVKFKVEIREHIRSAPDKSFLEVCQIWEGVDRAYVCGYSAGMNAKLAQRLKKAMEDGVAYPFVKIAKDVHGKTYAETKYNVLARNMNSELKKLGY